MLPMEMTSSPSDIPRITDYCHDIHDNRRSISRDVQYESTNNGDIVVVQPSFDDSVGRSSHSPGKAKKEWSSHHQQQHMEENQQLDPASSQNPLSLEERHYARHTRNLSAHFSDATTLSDRDTTIHKGDSDSLEDEDHVLSRRKHRRMHSNDGSSPTYAHRRINSIGKSKAVKRHRHQKHQRENSEGLNILSAAVAVTNDVSRESNDGVRDTGRIAPWDPPSAARVSQTGSFDQPTYRQNGPIMHPPPHRRSGYPSQGPYPGAVPYPPPSHYYAHPPPQGGYYHPSGFPPRMVGPPQPYPVQYSHRTNDSYHKVSRNQVGSRDSPVDPKGPEEHHDTDMDPLTQSSGLDKSAASIGNSSTQGSQTFVTAIAVGEGSTRVQVSRRQKHAATSTEDVVAGLIPNLVGHHRKLSSFSSLGTIMGPGFLPPTPGAPYDMPDSLLEMKRPGHHRVTSSSISFLQGLDVGLDGNDVNFLRDLHASNNGQILEHRSSSPSELMKGGDSTATGDYSGGEGTKLAVGGTSKRVRRKCTVAGCPNRVVQGGLCISHGAKRKLCKHPGCQKNVKKAGMCSTHGPARKRCDFEGCQKVAVQGGRCIAHGAKKKLCCVKDCTKQAILSGMCKKHHDKSLGYGSAFHDSIDPDSYYQEGRSSSESEASVAPKATHHRGLSIFQEISADTVQSILNEEALEEAAELHRSNRGETNTEW
jgi:hypothetical protein